MGRCPTCNTENTAVARVCRSCGSALQTHAGDPAHALPAGSSLMRGTYTVGKVLGQGGFGITYLGSDVRLRRPVAIKECFPQGCARQGTTVQPAGGVTVADLQSTREKFLDEARVLALCQHAGIVQVFTSFQENNTAYIVMEFLKGRTLAKALDDSRALPEREAVSHIEKVGEALELVHGRGLLHRDIKPENVMLTDDGRVVLVDFGTAREFAAGRTRRMTRLLTPGYAPLEQYGEQARFGKFTDIYALGATLYHLLTGEVPVQATDRAAGVALPSPHRKKPSVSRTVSDAVMWAMEVKVDRRPQSVRDFVSALRGSGPRTTTGSRSRGRAPKTQQTLPPVNPHEAQILDDAWLATGGRQTLLPQNPYETQIGQLAAELAKPVTIPPSRFDTRIAQITAQFAALTRSQVGQSTQCPACRKGDLHQVMGQPTGRCPVCQKGALVSRRLDTGKCPVCRDAQLTPQALGGRIFCPVCRIAPLQDERRKRFGVRLDLWWVCGHCGTEMDVVLGGKAKLVQYRNDPYGVGAQHLGQTFPVGVWGRLSERAQSYHLCGACGAQLDVADGQRLTLVHVAEDRYRVGTQLLGKTLYRTAWAKLAAGLSLNMGNAFCPSCGVEFDEDRGSHTLTALQFGREIPAWARPALGKPVAAQMWYLAAAGKRSMKPGWLCRACSVEFDDQNGLLKLVSTPTGVLTPHAQRSYMLEDWQRIASGLPTRAQEKQLREELARLQQEKQKEHAQLQRAEENRRAHLDTEVCRLLKQSLLEGWIPLSSQSPGLPLRSGESLRWECQALRWKQRSSGGRLYWDADIAGVLVVTVERVLFQPPGGSLWHKPVAKLMAATTQYGGKSRLVVMQFDGLQKPVAFEVSDVPVTVSAAGLSRTLMLTAGDLVGLVDTLRQRR